MKPIELHELGIPKGQAILEAITLLRKKSIKDHVATFEAVAKDPASYSEDELLGPLARAILDAVENDAFLPREEPAPWKQWGEDLEETAVNQMRNACDLRFAVDGAV